MPILPLFGEGFFSKSANVTRQRRLNLYMEPQKDNDKSPAVLYGTPGLALYQNFGILPSRGMFSTPQPGVTGDWLYTVHGNQIWIVSPTGIPTLVGTIKTTTGLVSMAWNGTQIVFVDGQDGWIFTPGVSALQELRVLDPDFPTSPQTVTFLNGYFIVSQGGTSGRFYWSDLNNGASWGALNYATAESNPDGLSAVFSDYGELYLLGTRTVEAWGPSGDANVWARLGGAVAEWGLVSNQTLSKFDTGIIFLAQNRLGQAQVVRMQGYQAQPICPPEVANAINADTNLSAATGFSYLIDAHPFYQLNLTNRSFLYDALADLWSEVQSGLTSPARHYAERRAQQTQDPYVSDYRNGNIYRIDPSAYTDNGDAIVREVITRHIFKDYDRTSVNALQIDMEEGVGLTTGQGSTPQAMLQISKDGGHTWGNEIWATIGAIGNYATRVIWRRLGSARDWLFKIRITDPVKVVIIGGSLDIEGDDQ